jgi:hypothetical protein
VPAGATSGTCSPTTGAGAFGAAEQYADGFAGSYELKGVSQVVSAGGDASTSARDATACAVTWDDSQSAAVSAARAAWAGPPLGGAHQLRAEDFHGGDLRKPLLRGRLEPAETGSA